MQAIGFDQNPPESVAQLLGLCRFCLKRYSQMKTISPPADEPKPSASDIPEMFALLTGVEVTSIDWYQFHRFIYELFKQFS